MKNASGKLVIIGILTIAFVSAGISWWFRYNATHRAAEFWDSEASYIRNAPIVELYKLNPAAEPKPAHYSARPPWDMVDRRDISAVRGLTHLRNALLEDRSYRWPEQAKSDIHWAWALIFRDDRSQQGSQILFSPDWRHVRGERGVLSCEPIAAGLSKMFDEITAEPPPALR